MNYFGNAGVNERSAGASSARKGKKCISNKPKQPQRGPGVAQLEKIRLLSQLEFHPQMSMDQLERSNMIFGLSQPSSDLTGNANNAMFEAEHYAQPGITRHLFHVEAEDSQRKKKMSDSMGLSSSRISDSNSSQELDLELRLSL